LTFEGNFSYTETSRFADEGNNLYFVNIKAYKTLETVSIAELLENRQHALNH